MASHWRALLVVATMVAAHAGLHSLRTASSSVPAARDDRLRVVSWNLRNFPGDHDLPRLRAHLDRLRPQVLALQEVLDPDALTLLRPDFRWHASVHGGRHGPQRLVLGWDPEAVELVRPIEHDALSMDGRVRPGLSAYLRSKQGGPDFHLMVVHLKATRDGHPVRVEQWSRLGRAIDRIQATGPVDEDLLVVGDFNVAGGKEVPAQQERRALEDALRPRGLRPWPEVGGCTAYWDGRRRDAWLEPSALDLVFGAGLAEVPASERRSWPGAHCARHGCAPIHASEHHPEPDLHGVSDHCPMVIDLPLVDDDP